MTVAPESIELSAGIGGAPGVGRRLVYATLEAPRPGQASYTHVHEIVGCLREIGWDVTLVAAEVGPEGGSRLARFPDYARLSAAVARALRRADALYLRAHPAAVLIARGARRRGLPVFQEINGKPQDLAVTYPWLRPLLPAVAALYRTQLTHADHVFAVTEGLRAWARDVAGHDRVLLVPNGANTRLFRPRGPRGAVEGRYVAFVGGLVAWHGLGTMLAATRSADWPADVRLVVVGDGPERDVLRGEGTSRVLWLGRRPYEEVPALLRGALAALCTIEDPDGRSAAGVAPLKLYEAMACGVPVVASDLPFQAELVRGLDAGVIVPVGDAAALARAVASLAGDPDRARRQGGNGAAHVGRHGSWAARAGEIAAVMAARIDTVAR